MKLFKKAKRRGSIMVVIVFGMAMAIIMLGMLRVGTTIYASGVRVTKQYADINSMRAIAQLGAYRYVTDLMSLYAQHNVDTDMPGTTDSAIFQEGLKKMQDELLSPEMVAEVDPISGDTIMVPRRDPVFDGDGNPVLDADGNQVTTPVYTLAWNVQDATIALASMGELHADTQTHLMGMVLGKDHRFSIELEEDMLLDYSNPTTFISTTEARVALAPVKILGTLKLKTETVNEHMVVEGLYLYAIKDIGTRADGSTYNRVSMRITDDGSGNGVYVYRG